MGIRLVSPLEMENYGLKANAVCVILTEKVLSGSCATKIVGDFAEIREWQRFTLTD